MGGIWLSILQPITSPILQSEGKKPQFNSIGGHPIEFDGAALHKKFTEMHIGIFSGISTRLVPLHKCDYS